MKKWMSMLLALVMLLCVACGDKGEQTPPSGIYYEVTNIDPRITALSVDGNEIPMELYCYWVAYNCAGMEYRLGMMNSYYGAFAELFNADRTLKWDGELEPGLTVSQAVKETSEKSAQFHAAVENLAKEHGVTLTEESESALAQEKDAAREQLGGEEGFQAYLRQLGISGESYDRLTRVNFLFDGLVQMVLQEDSPLYLAEEGYSQYATYADHILISTVDGASQPLPQEEIAAKRALAEDILAQLQAAEDLPALFAQLGDEYSEDPGRATNPTGYVYGPGEFVSEFEEAANALEPGEISGIVESQFGYHIILKKDLGEALAADSEKKVELAAQHLSALVQQMADEAQVVRAKELDTIDPGTFYPAYAAKVEEMNAAKDAAEAEGETSAVNDADSAK